MAKWNRWLSSKCAQKERPVDVPGTSLYAGEGSSHSESMNSQKRTSWFKFGWSYVFHHWYQLQLMIKNGGDVDNNHFVRWRSIIWCLGFCWSRLRETRTHVFTMRNPCLHLYLIQLPSVCVQMFDLSELLNLKFLDAMIETRGNPSWRLLFLWFLFHE